MMTEESGKCDICYARYAHYGNNPEPVLKNDKRVCDKCNAMFVIPARLGHRFDVGRARIIAEALKPYDVEALAQLWCMMLQKPTEAQLAKLKA